MSSLKRWVGALFLTSLLAASGCYRMLTGEAKRELRWKRRMTAGPSEIRRALKSARSLIRVPLTNSRATRFRYRMMGMRSLGYYMRWRGYDASLDQEAQRYYREALDLGDAREAKLELARFYALTGRRGRVYELVHGLEASVHDADFQGPLRAYEIAILTWESLMSRGSAAVAETAWTRAQELGKNVYDVDKAFPVDFGATGNIDSSAGRGARYQLESPDWRHRLEVLRERMFSIASPHDSPTGKVDLDQLVRLWSEYERIGMRSADDLMGRTLTDTYRTYLDGARAFASAGQPRAARTLLDVGRTAARHDSDPMRDMDLACTEAYVEVRGRRIAEASKAAERCLEEADDGTRDLEFADLVASAEALEMRGDLTKAAGLFDRAIHGAERQRYSYAVEERASFFRTSARLAYWGLARTRARASLAHTGREGQADFDAALRALELVRARQFGELLGTTGKHIGEFLGVEALRRRLLPGDLLLYFSVMPEHVLLFAVSRERERVEFLELDESSIANAVALINQRLSSPESNLGELDRLLTVLGRALLLPIQDLLDDKTHLVVLSDGPLSMVPFDLLDLDTSGFHPLGERIDVELSPSLAFFMSPLRRAHGAGMFGLGDAVYGEASAGNLHLAPLPETAVELKTLAALTPNAREPLLGPQARESLVKRAPLSEYAIIHFATHGVLGREVPQLGEPALVLSSEDGEDGFLTASEASALKLDADLTVLSACKTGVGDVSSGEGVLGMGRAFMLAGSRSVMVTLWSIDSLATVAVMVEFYRHLAAGQSPRAALRAAKRSIRWPTPSVVGTYTDLVAHGADPSQAALLGRRVPAGLHPHYWAGFTLIGP